MATLIKSKQIQGIVTASVVTGEFLVSGSLVVTGSNSILGSVTASAISSSFIGDGSGITGLSYSQISGTPTFVGGGDVTVTDSGGTVTISLTDNTGTDTQSLSISGDQLSISGGNTITLPSGSGVSDYSLLTNIPQGIVSGSVQILGGSGILSGSKTDISSLNTFTSSIQTKVDGISAVTSSFLTDSGSVSYTDITGKPTLISSSNQITITESQISDLDKYNDSDVKTKLDAEGIISGSIIEQLPAGVISGSTQITITQSQISDLAHTDVANLNTFTSSIQSEVDSLTSVTSSYLTTVPDGTISGSSQVIESLPSGVISGSTQISITESQISDLDKYTDSDVQSYVDSLGVVSGSVIAELPSGVISGSEQLPSGLISGSTQLVSSLPSGLISGSEQLPSGLISGSTQITITESQISDLTHTQIPDGTISGSIQVIDSLPDGVVSGSSQITVTESQISDLDKYTDSDVKTKLDVEGVVSGSVIRTIPSGTISGSEQLPSGLVSGSSQITITESQISDLSHTNISSLNTFTSSIQTEVDTLSAATSSYLTSSGSVDFSDITSLPSGLVSGSTQITDGSGFVSSSTQVIEHLPSGTVSGSTQITDGSGLLSSSAQIASDISSSYTELSQSLDSRVDILENFSGSTYTAASESIDTRLDALEGSVGFYYDLSNTVWNNKYIKSGSGMASNTSNFQTGNVPFKFRLNTDRKLQYGLDDVVYLSNFDRDTTITAIVSSSYETGSREVGLSVVSVNQTTGSIRINDSYWVISRHSAGFVDSASYIEASASFDHRIDVIVSSGSGADWNVNLTNIPDGIISSSQQQYTASIENGFALTSSVDSISASLATTIENVFQSSSNFDNKTLVSGSSQIDFRNITNYVADEHIDHTTISITAGDGLDGGGDIASTREVRLNVTSSHFETGVTNILTAEGVVKTSTLNTDLISTDFSQSVDTRIKNISAASIPSGTVSGSQQITNVITDAYISASAALSGFGSGGGTTDYTQLTNVPSGLVSGSIQILGGSGILSGSALSQRLDSLETFTGSLDAEFATDVELGNLSSSLSASIASAAQSGGGDGILSGSKQITDLGFISSSDSTTSLNTFTSSIQTEVDGLSAATSSYITSLPSGLFSGSLVAGTNVTINQDGDNFIISSSGGGGSVPSGTVSSSAQITYDGDRIISNDKLGDLFTDSVNPGTSGSVIDFLNAVFYPNSAPSISTGNQTIIEYVTSGTTITTVSGTDPEGQSITFGTSSLYTDDLVRVASNGAMTLNALAESSSFNTDLVGGVHGHKVEVTVTDSFGTTTEKDIYVIVTPNSTPVFRETSTSGNVITSVTANLNESSTDDTLVKRVYFSDANGDDITIYSSSIDNNHFDVTKYSTYVDIRQNTGSLDYEQQTSYTFSISASDEHYEAGQDSDSIVGLPITVNVTDNLTPTVNNQTLSSINENSSNGATVGSISAADNEGNTITFVNFELHQLQLDDSVVSSGSYSGTSQLTDPHENPFQMSTSGIVTRKTGVYLNSDLINEYIYRVQVTDPYNGSSNVALVTINITDDTPATLSDNWSAVPYIKESELSGTSIKTTNYGSTAADYGSNQSGTWTSSNSAISINSNGTLSLGVNLSGSVTQSGDTVGSTITFTNTFGTTTTDSLTLVVVGNDAPTATFTNQTSVFNTNEALTDTNLVSVSISDTESDSPYQLSIGGEDSSKLKAVPQNAASSSWELQSTSDLFSGTYSYDVTVTDTYSESTTYSSRTITIDQANIGTLGGDTTSYIIESAQDGDVFRDASGYNAGNASQVSVSYSPNYGSQVVQSYTSSNSSVEIDGSGYLTFNGNLSGTGSGETISSNITFADQHGIIGSGSVTINVFDNNHPSASFTENDSLFNTNQATGSTSLVDVSISDTESGTPYGLSISGTNASSFNPVPQNSVSSSWEIQPSADLSAGSYSYDVTITDNFGKQSVYNKSLTIAASDTGTLSATDTYIIESAETGDLVRTNSNGRTGTQSSVSVSYSPSYGSPVAKDFASSDAIINIDSSGRLSVGNSVSGSGNTNGSTISTTITWNDQYGNNGSQAISIDVTKNFAPTVNSTQTFSTNTNQATGSENIVRLNLTDTEGDTISTSGLSWTGYNTSYFTPSNSTGQMNLLVNSTSIPAGSYPYTASIADIHGFNTTVHSGSVTISQSDTGTLGGNTSIYSIESAESGEVYRTATGYNNGSSAQLSVSYSPSHGSPVVQSYTSSNAAIAVDGSGNLTLGLDISGSVTQSADTINSTITFADQYGNIGSGSVTATIFGNQSPAAGFVSSSNYESDNATSGSDAGALTVTDTESNSPFTISLGGTDGAKFDVSGTSSPFEIQPTGSLAAGTYSIDITVTDSYSETVTLSNETIVVDASATYGKTYVYNTGARTGTILYDIGASAGSGTPPTLSSYSGNGFIEKIEDGDLGSTSFSYTWGGTKTATLLASGSGANLDTILQGFGDITKTDSNTFVIIAPKDTDMSGVPTSMRNGYSGTATGEYVLEIAVDGASFGDGLGTVEASTVYDFDLGSAVEGTTNYHLIVPNNTIAPASSIALAVVPSSGSTP